MEIPARLPVGDAILALGSDGELYAMNTHVCGGLVLSAFRKSASLADFLANTDQNVPWQEYNGRPPERVVEPKKRIPEGENEPAGRQFQ